MLPDGTWNLITALAQLDHVALHLLAGICMTRWSHKAIARQIMAETFPDVSALARRKSNHQITTISPGDQKGRREIGRGWQMKLSSL